MGASLINEPRPNCYDGAARLRVEEQDVTCRMNRSHTTKNIKMSMPGQCSQRETAKLYDDYLIFDHFVLRTACKLGVSWVQGGKHPTYL